ncbi:MAG: DUF2513 domain-containing protein [Candidatus Binataceae bacterium]|jgi:hypothetical protein
MKLDWDLIREILMRIEDDPKFDGSANQVDAAKLGITNHTNAEVMYQVVQLIEGGFLAGKILSAGAFPPAAAVVFKLTWKGHEYVDSLRDPDIWQKTKSRIGGVAGVAFGVVLEVAKAEIMKKLKLS